MKFLLSGILIIFSTQVFAYGESVVISGDKDSHAVLPGDLIHAQCQPEVVKSLTKEDMYKELRALGHDISAVVRDSRFTKEQVQDIYRAILFMPKWMKLGSSFNSVNIKYKVDDSRNAVAWMKKSVLTINPLRWNKFVSDMRTSIIFHELAHLLGHRISSIDDSIAWQDIDGGWRSSSLRRNGSIYEGRPLSSGNLISNYAKTNPAEDFAESVSSYRIKPEALKETSPKRYEFLKDVVFLGNEFLDETSCNLEAHEVIDSNKLDDFFIEKLQASRVHFDRAYKYALRKKNQNPKRLEFIYKLAAMRSVLNSQGFGRKIPANVLKLKNELRIRLKGIQSISGLEAFQTPYSKSLLRKLLRR